MNDSTEKTITQQRWRRTQREKLKERSKSSLHGEQNARISQTSLKKLRALCVLSGEIAFFQGSHEWYDSGTSFNGSYLIDAFVETKGTDNPPGGEALCTRS